MVVAPFQVRRLLAESRLSPAAFREVLLGLPARERDRWLDRVFAVGDLPEDGESLPIGCVPYLPAPVDAVLSSLSAAEVGASDVFVDVGAGLGRVVALAHFLTGARAIGVEIQPELVRASRELTERLNATRVSIIEGDAADTARSIASGTVFFLYCPFSGQRLDRLLDDLQAIARSHPIRICSLDLPFARPWLARVFCAGGLTVHRSSC